jgi:sodium transport system permease protein
VNPTIVVFKKELRDMLRDKRTRNAAIVMPILLIIGILYLLGSVIGGLKKEAGRTLHYVKTAKANAVIEVLRENHVRLVPVNSVADAEKMIRDGRARVVLAFEEGSKDSGVAIKTVAYHDKSDERASMDMSVVQKALADINKITVNEVLKRKNIPMSAEPFKFEAKEVKITEEEGAGQLVIQFLPYFIIIWAFYGGMGIAGDLVAGEKEKNTLETLLITPVRRTQIVLGKFFALAVVCLISSLSSVVGFVAYAIIKPPGSSDILKGGLGINPTSIGTILLVLIPTVALFASLLVLVSSYAKNIREAQTHLSALSFVVIMPAIFVQFLGLTDLGKQLWINFIPILNTGANVRAAFMGRAELVPVLATIGVSLVLALIGLKAAIWMFNREEVLTRV